MCPCCSLGCSTQSSKPPVLFVRPVTLSACRPRAMARRSAWPAFRPCNRSSNRSCWLGFCAKCPPKPCRSSGRIGCVNTCRNSSPMMAPCCRRYPAWFGPDPDGPEGRLVRVEAEGHTFLLFTNLQDLAAELVALIYRYRWQIELFFKWIKCVLGCRHWMAESLQGMTLQVYCALIASVLLVLWTGRKPTKRQWEALQLYWLGCASLDELTRVLRIEKNK